MSESIFTLPKLFATCLALCMLAGCATSGKFGSYDRDDDGLVSTEEADGRIYFFDSYDKNEDGGLDQEEFKWAYAASKHRDEKKAGGPGTSPRSGGGILGGGGGGGGGGVGSIGR